MNGNTITSDSSSASKLTYFHTSKIAMKLEENSLKQDKMSFILRNVVDFFIAWELDIWSRDLNADFIIYADCLFVTVKQTKNIDPDKYSYTGYGIGFDSDPDFDGDKNVIIFGVDNSSLTHANNRKNIYFSSWWRFNARIGWYYSNSRK